VLVTDDLTMRALAGAPDDLAREALDAGCDIALHCSGELAAGEAVLRSVPEMSGTAASRLAAARAQAEEGLRTLDTDALAAERDRLLA
jgi:beta-N-acetylhexosaminidase